MKYQPRSNDRRGGGGQTIKAIQPIDRRPTIIQTLTEKNLNFATYTRVHARAREVGKFQLKSISLLRFVS